MNPIWLLLLTFVVCAAASLLLSGVAKALFPKFRSGEHKPGTHRSDLPAGGREIKTIELPLVGGPAIALAILGVGILSGYLFQFNYDQWTLLLLSIGTTLGYTAVGFLDDWNKVFSKEGLSEKVKFTSVFLVSSTAALLFFFLLPKSGQESYSFWKDLPLLNTIFNTVACTKQLNAQTCPLSPASPVAYYGWLIFLMLMTGIIGSVTSLSVDFSDGLDGLAGGLVFSAALALGLIVEGTIDLHNPQHPNGIVFEVLSLLCAGSVLGYLPWNWPSSWAARRGGTTKRRAKIYMGDSGALGLGGILAMIAVFSRNETLLLMIGGAFVLEGLSALISARLLTRFFRKRLQMLRFASSREFVPHTEFPLPFLATPLHHHFDLLGWDRRRLVYGAWALGACFAALGVIVSFVPFAWERYLIRVIALLLAGVIWSTGAWTKCYFVGKHPVERTRRRRLALYYGYPYQILGIRLCHLVEIIEASEDVIETPAEEIALWQRMSIFDARSMLGLYCYRAGYYPAALAQWTRIPEKNRALRPEIAHLLAEVDNHIALEKQETQPMKLNQILPPPPILSGNLPPADLPNPHEPIRSEETSDTHTPAWALQQMPPYTIDNDDDEEKQVTSPLLYHETSTAVSSNGHSISTSLGHSQSSVAVSSLQAPLQTSSTRQNWFARLFRFSNDK